MLLPFVCARPATLRVYVIGAEGPLADASASVSWHLEWGTGWYPEDIFAWNSYNESTNEDGYFDFRGLPPGVPFEVRASPQSKWLRMEPWDAPETRHGLDVIEIVDLRSGLQEVRMQIPSGSIRLELDLDREQALESEVELSVARVPDFIVDPSAPLSRTEAFWEDDIRYLWNHSRIHRRFFRAGSWRGRSVLFEGAQPGTYRAWASDREGRLLWASEPFLVGESVVDLGQIQVGTTHSTKLRVSGIPTLEPNAFRGFHMLAERVPEGNASDDVNGIVGDFEQSFDLLEGGYKLILWYSDLSSSSYHVAESDSFEVPETSEFRWEIPPEAFTDLPEARARLNLEDPD
jgi:hypothetical protein